MKKHLKNRPLFFASLIALSLLAGCTPTIQLDTPKDGITINMNVVVDHNIKVTMDKQAKEITEGNSKDK